MDTIDRTIADFDHDDYLNDDGTVTIRATPSAWHVRGFAPDTYSVVDGDHFVNMTQEALDELDIDGVFGDEYADLAGYDIEFQYDHFEWDYDHAAIVREFAQELCDWMAEYLFDCGLDASVSLRDTWSPREYNFVSDGLEVEVTCDPDELRALTEDFDVHGWTREHYGSYDGFLSFVTGRMQDDEWVGIYDGEFRLEYLMYLNDVYDDRSWIMRLAEVEYEVYSEHTTVTPNREEIRETILEKCGYMDSGYTLEELTGWAKELTDQDRAGMDPLFS